MVNVIFNDFSYEILPKQKETFDKYCKILRWGRQHPTRFLEQFLNLEFSDMQKYVLLNSWVPANCVWVMARNSGKALTLDTPVYVKRDNKVKKILLSDLQVGDYILDSFGNFVKVLKLNDIIWDIVYEIEFDDGEVIKCNKDHLWEIKDLLSDNSDLQEVSTEFLYKESKNNNITNRFFVPLLTTRDYNNQSFDVPPEIVGAYYSRNKEFDNTIQLSEDYEKKLKDLKIDELGIPNEYIYTTQNNLKKLLTGILSTKIVVLNPEDFLVEFKNQKEYEEIGRILSLAGIHFFRDQSDKTVYRIIFKLSKKDKLTLYSNNRRKDVDNYNQDPQIIDTTNKYVIFSKKEAQRAINKNLEGKQDLLRIFNNDIDLRKYKGIINVKKKYKKEAMRCITIDNDTGTFVCGNFMTVTHNSYLSSPFMMARAMLFPNTNTYIMAPSGTQTHETFTKMENLAKNNIASVIGVTPIFLDETVKANSKADPFVHDKNSYHVELFNGSTINTLNSVAKNIVGIRSILGRFKGYWIDFLNS